MCPGGTVLGAAPAQSQCVSAEFAISNNTSPRRANATTTIRREYYVGTERLEEEAGAWEAPPLDSAGIKDAKEGL